MQTGVSAAPASTFVLLDGSKKSTDDLKGKVTLVNFWATSCTTCVGEMPKVIATYEKYRQQGYDTLAVAMSYDPPAYVVNFAQTRKLPFKVAIDNTGAVAKAWGVLGLGMTNRAIAARAADSPEFFTSIATLAGGRILSVPGGVFVRDAEGRLLGAVGVTGDASLNDEAAALAGISSAGLVGVTGAES